MPIYSGIISMWRMEETSGDLIDQFSVNNLTATNITYQVTGKVNKAVSFDGTSTSIAKITNANQRKLDIPSSEDRTYAFWFNTSNISDDGIMLDKRSPLDSPAGATQIYISSTGAIQCFFVEDFGGNFVTLDSTTTGLNDGNWHLLICTFTRSATGLRLYIDNSEDASSPKNASALAAVASFGSFTLGGSDFSTAYQYTGVLDEVIIWNRVITAGERTTLWNSGAGVDILPVITDDIVSAWPMEDLSGNLADFVGSNILTATSLTYQVTGKVNKAVSFNGSSSFASITNASQTGLNIGASDDRSIAIWFKNTGAIEQQLYCKPSDESNTITWEIVLDSGGGVQLFMRDGSSNISHVISQGGYNDGNFHLALAILDRASAQLRLIVDNVEYAAGPQPSPADSSSLGDLTNAFDFIIGKRTSSTAFLNGVEDELIIWNRVLTATDRATVWNNGFGRDIFSPISTPEITSITPISSYTQGGNLIEIAGHQFSLSSPTIDFGGALATNVQVVSSDYLTCAAPAHVQSSSVTITLTNSDGGSTTFPGFSYEGFSPSKVLRPPKYFRNGILSFAQRRDGVNNYTP